MADNRFIRQAEARQKRIQSFAFVIAVSVSVCFAVCFVVSGFCEFGPAFGGCEIELDSRINPNDASLASLVRLPGIGISRAGAVVAYRENFGAQEPNGPAFQDCDDLQKVRGIGPKTAQNICGFLKFE